MARQCNCGGFKGPALRADAHLKARQIKATVEVVEPMGSETFLYMTTGRYPFIARVDAFVDPAINTELPLLVNMARAHFFSREDEAAIV